jgi:small subunit ribosomal protein S6
MLILSAEADEALVGTAVDRIAKAVSAEGGVVGKIDRWGRRRFAYEIDKQTEGYYVVVRFSAEPSTQPQLERALHLADEVIRHKVIVLPEGLDAAIAKRNEVAAARSAARAAAASASSRTVEAAPEPAADGAAPTPAEPQPEEASSPAPA